MKRSKIINYLYDVNTHADVSIEDMADYLSEEPKTGEWLWELASNGWADHICSKCGWKKNTDVHVTLGYLYCPKCGSFNGRE